MIKLKSVHVIKSWNWSVTQQYCLAVTVEELTEVKCYHTTKTKKRTWKKRITNTTSKRVYDGRTAGAISLNETQCDLRHAKKNQHLCKQAPPLTYRWTDLLVSCGCSWGCWGRDCPNTNGLWTGEEGGLAACSNMEGVGRKGPDWMEFSMALSRSPAMRKTMGVL